MDGSVRVARACCVKVKSVFGVSSARRCAAARDVQKVQNNTKTFRLRFPQLMELQSFFSPLTMERKAPFADHEGRVSLQEYFNSTFG